MFISKKRYTFWLLSGIGNRFQDYNVCTINSSNYTETHSVDVAILGVRPCLVVM